MRVRDEKRLPRKRSKLMKELLKWILVALSVMALIAIVGAITFVLVTRLPLF